MNYLSIGDMAQTYRMQRHNVQLKQHMNRLTEEMTTGVKADLAGAVSGDFTALAGIDHALSTLAASATVTAESALYTSVMQHALGAVQDIPAQIGTTLLSAATTTNATHLAAATTDARQKFLGAVATLNVQVGERFVFAGAATDVRPFARGDTMLAELKAATALETTATGVAAAVQAWFDAAPGGGGFLDTGYFGSDAALAPFRLGPDESAGTGVIGSDPAIRSVLKGLAMAALIADGVLPGDTAEQGRLARMAGESVLGAEGSLVVLRSRVGTVEAHIDQIAARNGAESTALQIARTQIVAADPYDTASALEAVTAQMETLYTLTARLSRLNFADYL